MKYVQVWKTWYLYSLKTAFFTKIVSRQHNDGILHICLRLELLTPLGWKFEVAYCNHWGIIFASKTKHPLFFVWYEIFFQKARELRDETELCFSKPIYP